ncbi:MAG: 16S rRNA (cytidine(1402)-2'-O)-methyltransferase [Candidatus Nealsonbacteria bacterium]|nr:16S rRNA (cytidine(1402)-2'-O)-methyltransferase [Candidatus Nealsonbacteria bacterium]
MATLYIVATPIGNLDDITSRALNTLKEVDFILCEDTRRTKNLLTHFEISTPTLSYHHHSDLKKVDQILNLLDEGKELALVSDAGTPGISDPGGRLIEEVINRFGESVYIVPIPGCSAAITAASIAGFSMDRFIFLGFPPSKNKRNKFFEEAMESKYPVIIYESPHRISKTLKEIMEHDESRGVVVCRELTKKFETIHRGSVCNVLEKVEKDKVKGEFTLIIRPRE